MLHTELSQHSKNPCLDATDQLFQKSNDCLFCAVSLLVSVSTSLEIDNKNFLLAAHQDRSWIQTIVPVSRSLSGVQFMVRGVQAKNKQGNAFETFS